MRRMHRFRSIAIPVSRQSLSIGVPIAIALIAGCTNWSGDVAVYRKVLDANASTTRPTTQPTYEPAKPLTLRDAMAQANHDNETIGLGGENYIQALAEKMREAGTFLPTISLGPTYTLARNSGSSETPHQLSVPINVSAVGSLTNVSNYQAAGRTVQQQAQLMRDVRETILLQVIDGYYDVLTFERQIAVYENSVNLKTEKVRDQEERRRLGILRPLDEAQSQADLASTVVSLTQARTNAANSRSALARLMGMSAAPTDLTDEYTPPNAIETLDRWQTLAQSQRQDLLATVEAREAARLSVEAAIREYYPTITINFEYFLYNDPKSALKWTNAITGSLPIFSALTIEGDIRRAWSVYRQAGLSESATRHQVIDDINEGYQSLESSRLKIEQLKVEVDAAERAADYAEREYALGKLSNLDRLTQQDALLSARLQLVTEQLNTKRFYLNLLRAAGKLATVLP